MPATAARGPGSNQYGDKPPVTATQPPPAATDIDAAAGAAVQAPFLSARTTDGEVTMPMQAQDLAPGDRIDGKTVTATWEVDPDIDDPGDDPGYTAVEFHDGAVETFRPDETLQTVPAADDCFDADGYPKVPAGQ